MKLKQRVPRPRVPTGTEDANGCQNLHERPCWISAGSPFMRPSAYLQPQKYPYQHPCSSFWWHLGGILQGSWGVLAESSRVPKMAHFWGLISRSEHALGRSPHHNHEPWFPEFPWFRALEPERRIPSVYVAFGSPRDEPRTS